MAYAADEDLRRRRLIAEIRPEWRGKDHQAAAAVIRDQHSVGVVPEFAGGPQPPARRRDRARVNGLDRRVEKLAAFEKERAALGKENREALIRRDDRRVGFDLREIGIDGGVDRRIVVRRPFQIDTCIFLYWPREDRTAEAIP